MWAKWITSRYRPLNLVENFLATRTRHNAIRNPFCVLDLVYVNIRIKFICTFLRMVKGLQKEKGQRRESMHKRALKEEKKKKHENHTLILFSYYELPT